MINTVGPHDPATISGSFTYTGLGGPVVAGILFTARDGGVSTGPWQGLNLGAHVGDDPKAVAANRRLVESLVGDASPVTWMDQVHGTTIGVVGTQLTKPLPDDAAVVAVRPGETAPATDALVTCLTGVPLAVLVADCVPVILVDETHGVCAAVHAGRAGAVAGIARTTLAVMAGLGATPDTTKAFIGPSARGCCYELPADMVRQVETGLPGSASVTVNGTPGVDLAAGLNRQLRELGVGTITISDGCTICGSDWFSYRKNHTTGRQAGLVWLQ